MHLCKSLGSQTAAQGPKLHNYCSLWPVEGSLALENSSLKEDLSPSVQEPHPKSPGHSHSHTLLILLKGPGLQVIIRYTHTRYAGRQQLETSRQVLDLCLVLGGLAILCEVQPQAQHEGLHPVLAVGDMQRLRHWGAAGGQ